MHHNGGEGPCQLQTAEQLGEYHDARAKIDGAVGEKQKSAVTAPSRCNEPATSRVGATATAILAAVDGVETLGESLLEERRTQDSWLGRMRSANEQVGFLVQLTADVNSPSIPPA